MPGHVKPSTAPCVTHTCRSYRSRSCRNRPCDILTGYNPACRNCSGHSLLNTAVAAAIPKTHSCQVFVNRGGFCTPSPCQTSFDLRTSYASVELLKWNGSLILPSLVNCRPLQTEPPHACNSSRCSKLQNTNPSCRSRACQNRICHSLEYAGQKMRQVVGQVVTPCSAWSRVCPTRPAHPL